MDDVVKIALLYTVSSLAAKYGCGIELIYENKHKRRKQATDEEER